MAARRGWLRLVLRFVLFFDVVVDGPVVQVVDLGLSSSWTRLEMEGENKNRTEKVTKGTCSEQVKRSGSAEKDAGCESQQICSKKWNLLVEMQEPRTLLTVLVPLRKY